MTASIISLVHRTRKDGRFPTLGVFMMGWLLTCWQDVGVNAVVPVFSYNSAFLNMGTWGEFVPGWVAKGPETPAPILYELADYMLFLPLAVVGKPDGDAHAAAPAMAAAIPTPYRKRRRERGAEEARSASMTWILRPPSNMGLGPAARHPLSETDQKGLASTRFLW